MRKLAIFGGTFNPVHYGHLLMAETALTQFALDGVIWVPTNQPPYKSAVELPGFHHRLEMVQRAIAAHPHFICSDIEHHLPTPTYAIDTLTALQAHYPQSRWHWLMGVDAFQSLPRWYRYQDLVPQCCWLIAPRWGMEEQTNQQTPTSRTLDSLVACKQVAQTLAEKFIHLEWHLLTMPRLEISSSLIRHYCRDRRSIRYLLPESVRAYILEAGLY
jgi:nicotinate-nucleotide adenylyltransferase